MKRFKELQLASGWNWPSISVQYENYICLQQAKAVQQESRIDFLNRKT